MDTYLPPLLPEIQFDLLPKTEDALRAIFEIKRNAMKQHIIKQWVWDDDVQTQIHKRHFETKPFYNINRKGECVGVVSFLTAKDHVRFGEFYLLDQYRGNGLGTRILRHCLSIADEKGLPVKLEYLKWNPVGNLYRRHGFAQVGQSDIHYFMERPSGRF